MTYLVNSYRFASAGATLAFHAATFDGATYEMEAQAVGTGTPTFTVDDGTLLPDADGVFVPITLNTAPWYGARWSGGTAYADDGGGTPLAEAPSLYSGPALTNLCLYSNDQTNAAWSKVGAATATRNQTGLTGAANTACLLEDADTVVRNVSQNNIVVADNTNSVTLRAFIRKESGDSDLRRITVRLDGGTVLTPVLDLRVDTGAVSSSSFDAESVRDAGGWWEVLCESVKPGNGSTSYDLRFQPRVTTSVSSGFMVLANAELFDNATIEQVTGSSPIVTAGATVSQAAVNLSFAAANHSDDTSAYYCEFKPLSYVTGTSNGFGPIMRSSAGRILYSNDSSIIRSYDGSNIVNGPSGVLDFTQPNWAQLGLAYGDSSMRVSADGSNGTEGSYDGGYAGTDLLLVKDEAGSVTSSAGLVRNIRRYDCADFAEAKETIDGLMP